MSIANLMSLHNCRCNKTVNEYVYRESTFRYLNAYSNIEILRAALSVCVIAWVLAVVILLLRCCCFAADFKMMEVTIKSMDDDDDEEEVSHFYL